MLQLFHLNTFELEERIRDELEENPLIEEAPEPQDQEEINLTNLEDTQDFKDWDEYEYDGDYYNNSGISRNDILLTKYCAEDFKSGLTQNFRNEAIEQLHLTDLSQEEKHLGEFIIQSITDDGFLETDFEDIVDDYSLKFTRLISLDKVKKLVGIIQGFEPIGLASSCIRECLLVQLRQMKSHCETASTAIKILCDFYEELKTQDFRKIEAALAVDKNEIDRVLQLLGKLKLKPVAFDDGSSKNMVIIPDFVVTYQEDGLYISLYRERASSLKINPLLKGKINNIKNHKRGGTRELSKKLHAAEWFVNAIKERESVMLQVMNVIANLQYDYFMTGDELQLKPMILKDVADRVGVDVSTVSRITSNKYVQMPFGSVLLKSLFQEGIANKNGEMINVLRVHEAIREVVDRENKSTPYTDAQIATVLSEKGYKISRRTVTKYRNEIKLPSVKERVHTN